MKASMWFMIHYLELFFAENGVGDKMVVGVFNIDTFHLSSSLPHHSYDIYLLNIALLDIYSCHQKISP